MDLASERKKKTQVLEFHFSLKKFTLGIFFFLVSSSKFFRTGCGITLQNNRMMSRIEASLLNLPTLT